MTRTFIATVILASIGASLNAAELKIQKGDHICLVGNALGERMQHRNHWETLLYQRFSDQELVVRNLCFPGDEPLERLRSLNFGTPDDHLKHSQPDAILFFFGFNESFAGHAGLKSFTNDLTKLVKETKTKNYSGKGAPRVVLVSPIAFENTGDRNLSDGIAHNKRLAMYAAAMKDVAATTNVGFVDLFVPTKTLFAKSKERFTLDGAHLNDVGYRALASILDRGLFGADDAPQAGKSTERLHATVADKNFHWWHRYRAVNGYSIYGKRGSAGADGTGTYRNRDVMERERTILDQMCANRDARIWKLAQGKTVPDKIDDSNTLPFIKPKTNVGGPNDKNRKAGKLGSLEYIPAADQIKHFKMAAGYEINLFASEEQFPELANPVAMNFDNKGRLWVSTMPSYPQWRPKTKLDDKLIILEDKNGDGRADTRIVFARGLHQPTGFELGRGGVYVAQQPDILFLKDTDGDDREDVRIRQLVGFDTADSHHGLAAFEWGPGGGLYFQEGTFKQSQVESPYGLTRMGDAGTWRYDPRTARFEAHVSLAFANPWGHVFDRWGQNFIADASPGNNYWATPISGHVAYPDKHAGGSRARNLDFGGSKSSRPYPTFIKKRIRPTSGCEFVSSRNFPPETQGNFLVNNVIGELTVLQHRMKEVDSGFVGEEVEPILVCTHGNFRPVDLQFGPDGALYIVDWHNALIGHLQHNLRDPSRDHSHGRIWRVSYSKRPLVKPAKIAGAPIDDLLDLLREPEDRTRYRVRRELAERDSAKVIAAVDRWIAKPQNASSELYRLEALWVHQTHNAVDEALLKRVLASPDYHARAAATRVLSFWRDQIANPHEFLRPRIDDEHPRVRLEAVRACSFIPSARSLELALDVLNHPMDTYLEYTLDETLRALETALGNGQGDDEHAHQHDHGNQPGGPPPLVFLDKKRPIVEFQLARLPASRLLSIKRSTEDRKFLPVYAEILRRKSVSRQDREESANALSVLNKSSVVTELQSNIGTLNWKDPTDRTVVKELASILLKQSADTLAKHTADFRKATGATNEAVRAVALAGLVSNGNQAMAWKIASRSPRGRQDMLAAVPMLLRQKLRAAQRDEVLECLNASQPLDVRRAAIVALASVPTDEKDNFHRVAPLVSNGRLRAAAVRTLSRIPKEFRSRADAQLIVTKLVGYAARTPAARRTTPNFLDAMQLADELLALLPAKAARESRNTLSKLVVRVVRIDTVHEEMRYNKPFFAVAAGRPVQLVLRNDDLMPHNLVICAPGKLRDVAMQAAELGPAINKQGRQYVPTSKDVLFATKTIPSHQQDVLTFTAPRKPGAYPYVCTFPNHWMRMYGVMVVVEDLDAWLAKPVKPADPLGLNRDFVKKWTMEDFEGDLSASLRGRSPLIGQKIFKDATCVLCHKLQNQGGAAGPDLAQVFERWKGKDIAVLREVLDPSHKIDPKYAAYTIVTDDGKVVTGIIVAQNQQSITVVTNAAKPKPHVIPRDEIDEMIKQSTSLMPKGIMDRFTRDEIFELLAYIKAAQTAAKTKSPE